MTRPGRVSIIFAILVVIAFATVGLLRHGMGQPVADTQVSSSSIDAYYRSDLEALYLHEVRTQDDALSAFGDTELLARGHGICSALDAGTALPEGGTAGELDAAVRSLCPQHAGVVSS